MHLSSLILVGISSKIVLVNQPVVMGEEECHKSETIMSMRIILSMYIEEVAAFVFWSSKHAHSSCLSPAQRNADVGSRVRMRRITSCQVTNTPRIFSDSEGNIVGLLPKVSRSDHRVTWSSW